MRITSASFEMTRKKKVLMSPPKIFIAESWLNSLTRGTVCIADHFRMDCNMNEIHREIICEYDVFKKNANSRAPEEEEPVFTEEENSQLPNHAWLPLSPSLSLPPTAAAHGEEECKTGIQQYGRGWRAVSREEAGSQGGELRAAVRPSVRPSTDVDTSHTCLSVPPSV